MKSTAPSWISRTSLTLVFLLASALVTAQAQTFKVLHAFHGSPHDGEGPEGVLLRDAAGDLYGVTAVGGAGIENIECSKYGYGCGTAFKLDKTGTQVWLYSFKGANGAVPYTGLLRGASGNLYGTTVFGGTINHTCSLGCGVVFKLHEGVRETALYKFTGNPDAYYPSGPLVEDGAGNLYGTSQLGGTGGVGTVFKVDKTGKETVMYSFTGGSDGCFPDAGLTMDAAGNLYGVTLQGGAANCNYGYGVAFKLDVTGKQTVLHTFGGGDGAYPSSALLFDAAGNLYGVTSAGGSSIVCGGGCGTVFELSPTGNETVLYSFCSLNKCADGSKPKGRLARDSRGNLYGTTDFGGNSNRCNGTCGVAFKLDTTGKETVLHNFTGGTDGAGANSLVMDAVGNLYGVAVSGGDSRCNPKRTPPGCGVVFKITP